MTRVLALVFSPVISDMAIKCIIGSNIAVLILLTVIQMNIHQPSDHENPYISLHLNYVILYENVILTMSKSV